MVKVSDASEDDNNDDLAVGPRQSSDSSLPGDDCFFGRVESLTTPDDVVKKPDWLQVCASRLVIYDDSKYRRLWSIVLFVLLVYTGTIFPYRLCFLDFKIPDPIESSDQWKYFEYLVDGLFWVDFVINFFFTYTDPFGNEIDDIRKIVYQYVTGYCAINFLACLPEEAVSPIFKLFVTKRDGDSQDTASHKMVRITRLQRITRLARLVRLVRLAGLKRLVAFAGRTQFWRWLQGLRGMRVINFVVFLFWIVHVLSCGWYLCAACHIEYKQSWVGRRAVDADGTLLLERGSFEQWLNSMYFVFTIFTTVGFGDMSAFTSGEIVYVILVMLIGAVVHSIIVSEMINIVTYIDTGQLELMRYRDIIEGFAQHARIDNRMKDELKAWLEHQAQQGSFSQKFDKEAVRDLVTNGMLPAGLLRELPQHIYGGYLQSNRFLQCCLTHTKELPPRACILISLCLVPRSFQSMEVVYQLHDHPFNLFMVDGHPGVFAYVARPTADGGLDEMPVDVDKSIALQSHNSAVFMKADTKKTKVSPRKSKSALDISSSPSRMTSLRALGSSTDKPQKRRTEKIAAANSVFRGPDHLYPYQLFCAGNFFGDVEVLQGGSRCCTARCEESGSLLVLHRQDLWRLMDDFPHFASAWRASAGSHARQRLNWLGAHKFAFNHRCFAATRIQRFYRQRLADGLVSKAKKEAPLERRRHKARRATGTKLTMLLKGRQGVQAEEDYTPNEHGSMRTGSGGGGSQSKMCEMQAELQHELHNGLQNLSQDLQAIMKELKSNDADTSVRKSLRSQTSRRSISKDAAPLPPSIPADAAPSPPGVVDQDDSRSAEERCASLKAENDALRALIAEQDRHMEALRKLVPGLGGS